MKLTKDWERQIREYWNIFMLREVDDLIGDGVLWVTRCSKTKNKPFGLPTDLYCSPQNVYFYNWAMKYKRTFGVVSDKYGLHLQDEGLDYYNIHPSSLDETRKKELGGVIRQKTLGINKQVIAFYNQSPLMSIPYFEMLSYSGLPIFYTTKLSTKVPGRPFSQLTEE